MGVQQFQPAYVPQFPMAQLPAMQPVPQQRGGLLMEAPPPGGAYYQPLPQQQRQSRQRQQHPRRQPPPPQPPTQPPPQLDGGRQPAPERLSAAMQGTPLSPFWV